MTEPFGEHTCACGQPAARHRFVGGWMCGACSKKQDHPWMQENPMTPPDCPTPTDILADAFAAHTKGHDKFTRRMAINGET